MIRKSAVTVNTTLASIACSVAWVFAPVATAAAQEKAEGEQDHEYEAGHGIHWMDSVEEAFAKARKNRRPVMIDFEADWCGWCKKLDRETYGDEAVIRFVHDRFVAVKVDVDRNQGIGQKYRVSGLPTILILSPEGEELRRLRGFLPPERFLGEVRKTSKSAEALDALRKAAADDPKDVDAQRAYARALFAAGSTGEALEILEAALGTHPEHPALLLDLGDVLRSDGKLKKARETYETILGLPDSRAGSEKARAYLPLGRLLVAQGEHKSAIEVLGKFLEANRPEKGKDNKAIWEAFFLRGYAHAVLKDAASALADLKVVREEDTDSPWGLRASYIIDIVEPR